MTGREDDMTGREDVRPGPGGELWRDDARASDEAGQDPQPPEQPAGAPFTMVGQDDAEVCVDGVCAVPDTAYSLVTDVKKP